MDGLFLGLHNISSCPPQFQISCYSFHFGGTTVCLHDSANLQISQYLSTREESSKAELLPSRLRVHHRTPASVPRSLWDKPALGKPALNSYAWPKCLRAKSFNPFSRALLPPARSFTNKVQAASSRVLGEDASGRGSGFS